MQPLINQLKNAKVPVSVTFEVFKSKSLSLREQWSDYETRDLIVHSASGKSRAELSQIFNRTTQKIFSKIQKHSKLLKILEEAPQ